MINELLTTQLEPKGSYIEDIFQKMEAILFYSHTKGKHTCFSNFSYYPVVYEGKAYPTSEHAFQAAKFLPTAPEHAEKIRLASDPSKCKLLGNSRNFPIRKDWESVKEKIMYDICLAKFSQHPDIRKELISTHPLPLVEHTANDSYWGDGGDGSGKNALGKCLMEVRKKLIAEQSALKEC